MESSFGGVFGHALFFGVGLAGEVIRALDGDHVIVGRAGDVRIFRSGSCRLCSIKSTVACSFPLSVISRKRSLVLGADSFFDLIYSRRGLQWCVHQSSPDRIYICGRPLSACQGPSLRFLGFPLSSRFDETSFATILVQQVDLHSRVVVFIVARLHASFLFPLLLPS